MGRPPSNLPPKRGRPSSSAASQKLSDVEQDMYNLIRSKEGMGIFMGDLKRELKLQDAIVKKSLKVLESQKLIKGVNDVHHKLNKHYMAVEFEASKEITSGSWYVEGKLDAEFIKSLKELCLKLIDKLEVATIEGLFDYVRRSGCFNDEVSSHQILEILQALVLDSEIEEVKSTGKGVFSSMPLGKVCYHRLTRRNPTTSILSSIPCGVCPRISECTPIGVISPINCVYFKKWLDF